MRVKAIAVLFLLVGRVYAQNSIVSTTTNLIVAEKYDEAHAYLDSILKKDSKNVDALMMKGNVLLNRTLAWLPDLVLLNPATEDYYNKGGVLQEGVKVLLADTALRIEKLWKQCLAIDSARFDIRKGLCSVYAMALMKEELKRELDVMIRQVGNDNEQAYNLAEYARKLKERGRFDDAIEIYRFIADRYPNLAGIRCDIASEYFYHGDLKEALQWFDSTFTKSDIDETTYLNAAFTYSQLGYYDAGQKLLDEYSAKFERNMGQFYRGVRLFAEMDNRYVDTLNRFIAASDSNAYYNEVTLARGLLLFKDTLTMNDYRDLVEFDFPEYYKVLLYQRGVNQFKDSCEAYIHFGVFNGYIKNYPAAVQLLEEGEGCKMSSATANYWAINYGYALYMMKEYDKALSVFEKALQSTDRYKVNAAEYFTAKILLNKKRTKEAKTHIHRILMDKSSWSKYQGLAAAMLQDILQEE